MAKRNYGKTLGELEQQIMDIVWQKKYCSVRDVLVILRKDYAYTTIATILQRLHKKGLVNKKKNKKGYKYYPKVTKEFYSKNLASSFLTKSINSFGDMAIASFADSIDSLPKEKKDYFIKILREHKKKI